MGRQSGKKGEKNEYKQKYRKDCGRAFYHCDGSVYFNLHFYRISE
jgi:hypothetical protein